jgi:hypothetical protein
VALAWAGRPTHNNDRNGSLHLAGATGRPAWIMLPHAPDWRWLLEREDTRWYPSLRLFRQDTDRDWNAVIDRVAAALAT